MSTLKPKKSVEFDRLIHLYGDLIYDLCESTLWSQKQAQNLFKIILRDVRNAVNPEHRFVDHERAWILKIASLRLRQSAKSLGRRITPAEQTMLDSSPSPTERLEHFDAYFHRLTTDEQMVLILRDKFGFQFKEISAILEAPEDSLKLRREQALRSIESWIWWENAT